MNIYESLNIIALSPLIDDIEFINYLNDSQILTKDYETILYNEKMLFKISIIKKRINYFEDVYTINLTLNDSNFHSIIIYENNFKFPHHDLPLKDIYTNEELLFLISIYSSLSIDTLYFTKDFNSNDIIKYANLIISQKEIKNKNKKLIL